MHASIQPVPPPPPPALRVTIEMSVEEACDLRYVSGMSATIPQLLRNEGYHPRDTLCVTLRALYFTLRDAGVPE